MGTLETCHHQGGQSPWSAEDHLPTEEIIDNHLIYFFCDSVTYNLSFVFLCHLRPVID